MAKLHLAYRYNNWTRSVTYVRFHRTRPEQKQNLTYVAFDVFDDLSALDKLYLVVDNTLRNRGIGGFFRTYQEAYQGILDAKYEAEVTSDIHELHVVD